MVYWSHSSTFVSNRWTYCLRGMLTCVVLSCLYIPCQAEQTMIVLSSTKKHYKAAGVVCEKTLSDSRHEVSVRTLKQIGNKGFSSDVDNVIAVGSSAARYCLKNLDKKSRCTIVWR